jgi:predicted secreted protein
MNNQEIEVKVILDDCSYVGSALIIDFPLSAIFNSQFKYSLRLLGSGELKLQK